MAGAQVDTVLGDRKPALEDIQALRFTTRVINESMRLYPQPPVLIRRALQDDVLAGYKVRRATEAGCQRCRRLLNLGSTHSRHNPSERQACTISLGLTWNIPAGINAIRMLSFKI